MSLSKSETSKIVNRRCHSEPFGFAQDRLRENVGSSLPRRHRLLRRAAHSFVNQREHRVRDAENIKRCDESIGKCQAGGSDCFVAARAYHNSLLAVYHATVAMKPAKKFDIFHQRHRGKSANINKCTSPTEDSMIAAAHSEQHACVMRETVRQPINQPSRQANPKIAADNIRIVHDARDLIQTLQWHFDIRVDKPKDLPVRGVRPGIHLPGTTPLALNEPIAEACREISRPIDASTVGDNNFGSRRSLAQMLKKRAYQGCLVKNWNDDRELHSNRFFKSPSTGFAWLC